jgi:hypothetical protein
VEAVVVEVGHNPVEPVGLAAELTVETADQVAALRLALLQLQTPEVVAEGLDMM